jgi:predicted amidohydrolase YtcJ
MNAGADLIIHNAKVLRMDAAFGLAEAVAVKGERIVRVGSNAEVLALAGQRTHVIDARGRTLMPGMVDGHAHLDREGLKEVFPSLGRVRCIDDIKARIAELVRQAKPGEWIVTMPIGDPPTYFDVPQILKEQRFPTRQDLDEVAPDNPVYIRSIWGFWRHTPPLVSIANSRALELAGLNRDSPSPSPLVKLERDASGELTGVFVEDTMMPIVELTLMRQSPGFTRANRADTLPHSFAAYHAYGTTSIFEEHGVATELLRAYKDARVRGQLNMRCTLAFSPNWEGVRDLPVSSFVQAWLGWLGEPALGDDFLKVSGLFVDLNRVPDNAARAQALPYTGWAGFNYDTALERERMMELLFACAENEIRPVAIWPNMLPLFWEVHQKISLKGRRWVLGHISALSEADMDKIAEMELVITSHTNRYVYKEGHLLRDKLGAERENEISPLASLVRRGVKISLATDNVPVSMFYPIWQAVTRSSRYSDKPIAPAQALTREQALRCATEDGAWISFDEHNKGRVEEGLLADLALLDRDPLTCSEDELKDTRADITILGGKLVYQREGA